jgi:hypothetical protein
MHDDGRKMYRRTLPRPEGDHETEPREEESAAICCGDGVEEGNRSSFLVDGIDFWRTPEEREGVHTEGGSPGEEFLIFRYVQVQRPGATRFKVDSTPE